MNLRQFISSVALLFLSAPLGAQEWASYGTISAEPTPERICAGHSNNKDIVCASPAPYVDSSGILTVGGGLQINGNADLTALPIGGTTENGALIQGPVNGHLVFDLRNNGIEDSIAFRYSAANNGTVDTIGLFFNGRGFLGLGRPSPNARLHLGGNTNAPNIHVEQNTITDTSSAAGEIASLRTSVSFLRPTFASNNSVTVTNAANLYIADAPAAGTNTTITRPYALYVAAGMSYFGGSVGIGTVSPAASALFDLTSTTRGFLPPRMTTAQRDAISAPAVGLSIYNTSTNTLNLYTGSAWTALVSGAAGSTGQVQFNSGGGFGTDNLLFWDNTTKRLGLGTSSPTDRLHVFTGGHTLVKIETNAPGGIPGLSLYSTLKDWRLESNRGGGTGNFSITDCGSSSCNERFVIDGAGNVGIGAIAPAQKLDIAGDLRLSGSAGANLNIDRSVNDGSLVLYGGLGTNAQARYSIFGSAHTTTPAFAIVSSNVFQIRNLSTTIKMTVDSSGNVGIGTASPAEKLEVAGNIKVAGTIQTGGSSATCSVPADLGKFRFNTTTGKMQICK